MNEVAKKTDPTGYPRRQGVPTKRAGVAFYRHALDITQADVAKELGVTQGRVSEIEAAGDELQLSTLRAYAKAMGYELEVCFTKDNLRRRAL
jgi:transcriptional regulator with XRE-family HTH domain